MPGRMPSPGLADSTERPDERASEMDGREEKDNARGERGAWKDTGMKEIRGKVRRFDDEGGYLLHPCNFCSFC